MQESMKGTFPTQQPSRALDPDQARPPLARVSARCPTSTHGPPQMQSIALSMPRADSPTVREIHQPTGTRSKFLQASLRDPTNATKTWVDRAQLGSCMDADPVRFTLILCLWGSPGDFGHGWPVGLVHGEWLDRRSVADVPTGIHGRGG
jgi:hypothetical protein